MNDEQRVRMTTIVLIERYREWLKRDDIEPICSDVGVGIHHARWMLEAMRPLMINCDPDFDLWKAQRWLGFIQYEMILNGYTTVTKERNYSRGLFKGTAVAPVSCQLNSVKKQIL